MLQKGSATLLSQNVMPSISKYGLQLTLLQSTLELIPSPSGIWFESGCQEPPSARGRSARMCFPSPLLAILPRSLLQPSVPSVLQVTAWFTQTREVRVPSPSQLPPPRDDSSPCAQPCAWECPGTDRAPGATKPCSSQVCVLPTLVFLLCCGPLHGPVG